MIMKNENNVYLNRFLIFSNQYLRVFYFHFSVSKLGKTHTHYEENLSYVLFEYRKCFGLPESKFKRLFYMI
jgi:hypothetical protein